MQSRRPLMFALLALAGALPRPAVACDSSSCALLSRGQSGLVPRGGWLVDLSFRYTDQGQPLLGSNPTPQALRPRVDFAGRRLQPFYHVELDGSDTIVQADAAYGLTSRLAITAAIPLLGVRSYNHIHYPPAPDPAAPTAPVDEEHGHTSSGPAGPTLLHLRTEGTGDALVGFRFAALAGPTQRLVAGLSLKVPVGKSQLVDTHDGGLFDPTMQPGSGSWDVVGVLQYAARRAGLDWSAAGSYQLTTASGIGYRFGNEAIGGIGLSRDLGRFTASCQFKAHHLERSEYLGQPVPSTGGSMLILSPGLRMRAGNASVYTILQLPVRRRVNEYQLASRGGLMMGVSRSF
jgi:hypothetical protein